MPLILQVADLSGPDEALKHYIDSGLRPILIHAPQGEGSCSCGKNHRTNDGKTGATGKHPIARSWQKPATLDELQDQLARLKFIPNVGIVLGEQPGGEYLVAIDVDDEKRLVVIAQDLGPLPETVRGESGRGYRLLFELGDDVNRAEIRNATGLCGEPGVDVKIKGGQVVVAPSTHPNGKKYTWTRFGKIARLPSAWALALLPKSYSVPEWAEGYTPQTMREDGRAKKRAEKYLEIPVLKDAALIASTREGNRNTLLHKRTVALLSLCAGLKLGGHWSWVQEQLHRAALAAGLPEAEVRRTIASAEQYVRESGAVRVPVVLADPAPASATPTERPPGSAPGGEPSLAPEVQYVGGDPVDNIRLSNDKGSPAKTAGNVATLLALHPEWRGGPAYDSYSQTEIWSEPLPDPIRSIFRIEREIVDADHAAVQAWLMCQPDSHRVRVGRTEVAAGIHLASSRKSVDLLRQWIDSLPTWDQVDRVDNWTTIYLGCEDNAYTRATGRAWMVALIERAISPGVVVDMIPVLEGLQKSGKNRALDVLFAGGPTWAPWIANIAGHELEKPETLRLACTRWVLHDDELRARDPKRVDALKSWASRERETFRTPYAKEITVAKRRALLVASTNLSSYLHDETGNRRWWPWMTGKIDTDALERDRLQILSEALACVRSGDRWRDAITDPIYEETLRVAEERRVRDPLIEQIDALLRSQSAPDPLTTKTIGTGIGYSVERIDRALEIRVGAAMRELGYMTVRSRTIGATRLRQYIRVQS
jgi:Virulence-associated protein E/Bifunctional DNA primase/polymerase, N-terminal